MKNKNGLVKTELSESMVYVSSKNFTFSLEDDKSRRFGVLFETINMLDCTGETEFKHYPFIVSASLMVNKQHKSFYEGEGKPNQINLMMDVMGYCGGVSIDHVLTNQVQTSTEGQGDAFDLIASKFSSKEACVIESTAQYGTIAEQAGRGTTHKYLQFKNEAAATKYIDLIISRSSALSMMIGFILDRPVNMIGDSGWSVFEKQVKGCKQYL